MRCPDYLRLLPLSCLGLFLVGCSLLRSCACQEGAEEVATASATPGRRVGFQSSEEKHAPPPPATAPQAMPPTQPLFEPTAAPPSGLAGLPTNFPSDVTLMEDAEVAMVQDLAGDARNVLVRTDEQQEKLYDFYDSDLRAKGWTLEQHYRAKEQSFLGFRKGKTIINVLITKDPKDPDRRIVGIMYQEDQPPEFGDF